jgi:hypothetical protein
MVCTSNYDSAEQRNVAGCENINLKYSYDRKLDVAFESDAIVYITTELMRKG